MSLVLLWTAIIALWGAKFTGKGMHSNYLDIVNTQAVKGIFVLLVFLRHFKGYVSLEQAIDQPFLIVDHWLGQLIVTLFFFYSGYGVYTSFLKKGQVYVKTIPQKRVLLTLLHFDLAVLLFLLMDNWLGISYSWKQIVSAFLAWGSVGNSNWFVWVILMLYLATWLVLRFIPSKPGQLAALTVVSGVYVVVFHYYWPDFRYWYDTAFCYVAGMWYALYRREIESFLSRKGCYWVTLAAVLIGGRMLFYWRNRLWVYEALAVVFCLAVVLVTMKLSIGNQALYWLGGQVFTVYILQRLPMEIFSHLGLNAYPYAFLAVSLALTLAMAAGFDWCLKRLDGVLLKARNRLTDSSVR